MLKLAGSICMVAALYGQTALTGGIRGTVSDAASGRISAAAITVESESLGVKLTERSDASGNFRFVRLAPASDYTVLVEAAGFAAKKYPPVTVVSGEMVMLGVSLDPASIETVVEVTDRAAGLTAESIELGSTVSRTQLDNLPTNGRNFVRFALVDPRVRNTSGLGADSFGQNRLSFNGNIFRDTQYRLDGNTNYDTLFNNTPLQRVSLSSIQEFRVLTNQFSAEHGSTSAGLIITTTKSGTDELHGEAFFYGRPSGIQSRPPLANRRVPNELLQGGAAAGGPLVANRTYWFANYEHIRQNRGSFIQSPAPAVYIGEWRDHLALAKFDHRFHDRHGLSLRINGHRDANTNPNDRVGGLLQPSAANRSVGQSAAGQVNDTMTWGGAVNEFRAGYVNAIPSRTSPIAPQTAVVRPAFSTEGAFTYSTIRTEVYQLADQVSWQRGAHTLKAGADFIRRKVRDNQFDAFGTYNFPAGPPQPGVGPISFTQRFGVARLSYGQTQWALFLQDTWRAAPRLTLNLGLRYDYQSILDDTNNLGPRVGFAWDVRGTGSTIVRGGYAIYYDQPFFHGLTQRFLLNAPEAVFTPVTLTPSSPFFPTFPDSFPAGAAPPPGAPTAPRNLALRNDALLGPYTQQWTFGIQQRLPGQWVLSVDGVRNLSVKQFLQYNLNAPSPFPRTLPGQMRTSAEADRTRPLFDPALGVSLYQGIPVRDVRVTTNGNTATYHALNAMLSRQMGRRFQANFAYTWSSAINSITDDHLGANPQEWNDVRRAERGPSDFNQRHRFVANGIASLPGKVQASAYLVAASALPVNALTGVDNNGDLLLFDRPAGFGRNAFRGTPHTSFDVSLMRPVALGERSRIELRADAFNLFNNQNYYSFNRVYGNGAAPVATFRAPIAGIANTDPGRQFTFGAKLLF
jgi:outer membrane receptor protein involved in Fe transport